MSNTLKALVWSFLEQSGSKIILLLVQIVLARILSPDAFGILAILLVVTQIADSVAQSGLGMALIQKTDSSNTSYSTGLWLSLSIALVLYSLIFISAPVIAEFYQMPDLVDYLRILGLIVIVNSANSIQRSYYQRMMSFKAIFKATTISAVVSGAIGIVLAITGFGVWSLIAQSLLQSMFTCLIMLFQGGWMPSFVFDMGEAKHLFSYGWKICITGILNVLYSGVSELIIGRSCSVSDLGIYSQGRKYPQAAIGVLGNSIANVLFPFLSAIKKDSAALKTKIKEALLLGSFIIVPISFLFAVIAEPLIVLLLTDKWLSCVPIFQLACLSNSVLILQLVNLRTYMALGNSALYLKLQIIKVLIGGGMICGTAYFTHDIYATAVATFLSGTLSVFAVDLIPAKRMHGYGALSQLHDVFKFYLLSAISSVVTISIDFLNVSYLLKLLLQCVVFISIYLLGAKIFHFEELERGIGLIKGLFERSR